MSWEFASPPQKFYPPLRKMIAATTMRARTASMKTRQRKRRSSFARVSTTSVGRDTATQTASALGAWTGNIQRTTPQTSIARPISKVFIYNSDIVRKIRPRFPFDQKLVITTQILNRLRGHAGDQFTFFLQWRRNH